MRDLQNFEEINDQLEALSDRLERTDETMRPIALKMRLAAKELRDEVYGRRDSASLGEAIYTLQSLRHDVVNADDVLDESGNVVSGIFQGYLTVEDADAYAVLKHAEDHLRTYQTR